MPDVRQNTIYGIGEFAKFMNFNTIKTLLPKCIESVDLILSNPEALSDENVAVTENAFITLGKIALIHSKDAAQASRFLMAMPLKGEEEAQEAHQFLFEQVLAGNQVLMGDCKDTMLKSVLAIKEAYEADKSILTDEGLELMNKVL